MDDSNADLWEQLELLQEQLENVRLTNSCLNGQLAERVEVERQRAAALAAQIMPASITVQDSSSSRRSAEDEFGEVHSCKRNRYRCCDEESGVEYSAEYADDDDPDEPVYRGPMAAGQRAAQVERRPNVTVLPATDDADDADLEFHETSVDSELSEGGVTYRSCSAGRPDEEELAAAVAAGLDVVAPQKVPVDQLREINAALRALAEKGATATTATADVEAQLDRLRLLLSAS